MIFKKKPLEERIDAAIRAEFAGLIAELEKFLREYRRRSRLKEEARLALEKAKAEARRVQFERIALKKRFWKAYYEDDKVTLSEIRPKRRSIERAVKKAERSLKKARTDFKKADFDEDAEWTVIKEKADAAEEKADLRIDTLEQILEGSLAETWRDVKGASQALRDAWGESRFLDTSEEESAYKRPA